MALPEVDARGALEAHAAAPGASAYAKRAGSRSVKTELGANLPTLAQAPDTRRPPVAVRVIDAVTDLPALATDVRFSAILGDKADMLEGPQPVSSSGGATPGTAVASGVRRVAMTSPLRPSSATARDA